MDKIISFLKGISLRTWIIIAIVFLIIIAIIIFISNKSEDNVEGVSMNKGLAENISSSVPRSVFPLQYGSNNPETGNVQRYLKTKGQNLGKSGPNKDGIDNSWGPLTDAAVTNTLKVGSISEALYKTLI